MLYVKTFKYIDALVTEFFICHDIIVKNKLELSFKNIFIVVL